MNEYSTGIQKHEHLSKMLLILVAILHVSSMGGTEPRKGMHRLENVRITREYIRVTYYSPEGHGVHLESESSGTSAYITVTSTNGKNLLNITYVSHDTLYLTIMDRDYLVTKTHYYKSKYLTEEHYFVPKTWKKVVQRALAKSISPIYLTSFLDSHAVEKTSEIDLCKLLQREEVRLMRNAALEIGRRGLSGKDSTAAMNFYILAMRFASILPPWPSERDCNDDENSKPLKYDKHKIPYHQSITKKGGISGGWCDNVDTTASGGIEAICNTCPVGQTCSGMCGPQCECWSMVCGDCCYHHGCNRLDNCCGVKNNNGSDGNQMHLSFSCFNVFGFKCDSPYNC